MERLGLSSQGKRGHRRELVKGMSVRFLGGLIATW